MVVLLRFLKREARMGHSVESGFGKSMDKKIHCPIDPEN